jgi:hypothetical protein
MIFSRTSDGASSFRYGCNTKPNDLKATFEVIQEGKLSPLWGQSKPPALRVDSLLNFIEC